MLPNLILTTRMIPPVVVIIPIFLIAYNLNLLNTHFLLIITYCALNLALVIWLLRDFFAAIPADIEEAAMLDGCTRMQTIYRVVLPIIKPGLVATSLICFIFCWNEFIFALTLSGDATGSRLRGDVDANSLNGMVQLTDVQGSIVKAESTSGDLELVNVVSPDVDATTVSGEVDFSGPLDPKGHYNFQSHSGSVTLTVPATTSARSTILNRSPGAPAPRRAPARRARAARAPRSGR